MAKVRHIVTVDEDEFDDRVFERNYYPRKVYKDGCGVQVGLMMTDAEAAPAQPRFSNVAKPAAYRPPVYPDYVALLAPARQANP
jgi:hypothetical protein